MPTYEVSVSYIDDRTDTRGTVTYTILEADEEAAKDLALDLHAERVPCDDMWVAGMRLAHRKIRRVTG